MAGQFHNAAAINADAVTKFAGELRDKGRSARTIQAYLAAIKGFTRWLAAHHKLHRDPLTAVKKPNPKTDRRHERRMLLPQEWRLLEAATADGPVRCDMTGNERLLLYRTAIRTGLRSSELRSLTRGRLFLDVEPPFITCKGGSTKNRDDARQYIQRDLAADLKAHIATKAPKAQVFSLPHESNLARMFRGDLADARRAWLSDARHDPQEFSQREQSDFLVDVNHDGEVADFHALRHTCGAWLAMTGVNPKVVQSVMRHKSITLTMDTYGHLFPGQEAVAVGQLRSIMASVPVALAKNGTTDSPENARSAGRSAPRAAEFHVSASRCDESAEPATLLITGNPEKTGPSCDSVPLATMPCYNLAPLAQSAEQLTLNQ